MPTEKTWTEKKYREAGLERLSVRLLAGYKDRLRALAEDEGFSIGEMIESWIELEEQGQLQARTRKAWTRRG